MFESSPIGLKLLVGMEFTNPEMVQEICLVNEVIWSHPSLGTHPGTVCLKVEFLQTQTRTKNGWAKTQDNQLFVDPLVPLVPWWLHQWSKFGMREHSIFWCLTSPVFDDFWWLNPSYQARMDWCCCCPMHWGAPGWCCRVRRKPWIIQGWSAFSSHSNKDCKIHDFTTWQFRGSRIIFFWGMYHPFLGKNMSPKNWTEASSFALAAGCYLQWNMFDWWFATHFTTQSGRTPIEVWLTRLNFLDKNALLSTVSWLSTCPCVARAARHEESAVVCMWQYNLLASERWAGIFLR